MVVRIDTCGFDNDNDDEDPDDPSYDVDKTQLFPGAAGQILNLVPFAAVETVMATEMDLGAYLKFRGWTPDEDDDLESKGYFVEVPEFGPGFMAEFSGFVFWVNEKEFKERFTKVPKKPH